MGAEAAFQNQNSGLNGRNTCFQCSGRFISASCMSSYWEGSWASWPTTILATKLRSPRLSMLLFPPKKNGAASSLHLSPPLRVSYPATLKWRPRASPTISYHPSSPLQCQWGEFCMVISLSPSRLTWLVQTLRSTNTGSASVTKQPCWSLLHRLGLDGLGFSIFVSKPPWW